jgi:hypothetical protein
MAFVSIFYLAIIFIARINFIAKEEHNNCILIDSFG